MQRIYLNQVKLDLEKHRQMFFISGPRQVGKTTLVKDLCKDTSGHYLNWDDIEHRELILGGSNKLAEYTGIDQLSDKKTLIIFDELHKFLILH